VALTSGHGPISSGLTSGEDSHPAGDGKALTIEFIVPVYNSIHHARNCIRSVLEHATAPYHLFVVNDCSDSHTGRELREMLAGCANATLLDHQQNMGYLRSVNEAIGAGGADIRVMLNSDAMLSPGACERLREGFESDESIGVISAVSTWANWTKIPFPAGANRLDLEAFIAAQSDLGRVDIGNASGFFFAVRQTLFKELGVFDEAYNPGYWEEADFCMLAMSKGWRVVVDRQLYIYHHGWGSFQKSGRDLHMERNRGTFMARWQAPYQRLEAQWRAQNPVSVLAQRLSSPKVRAECGARILFVAADGQKTQFNAALIQLVNGLVSHGINANIAWLGAIDETLLDMMPMYFRPTIGAAPPVHYQGFDSYIATCDRSAAFIASIGSSGPTPRMAFMSGETDTGRKTASNAVLPRQQLRLPHAVNDDMFYVRDKQAEIDILFAVPASDWNVQTRDHIAKLDAALKEIHPGIITAIIGPTDIQHHLPRIRHTGNPHRLTEIAPIYANALAVVDYATEADARLNFLQIASSGAIPVVDISIAGDAVIRPSVNCCAVPLAAPGTAAIGLLRLLSDQQGRKLMQMEALASAKAYSLQQQVGHARQAFEAVIGDRAVQALESVA
jgi:GT2 family glycosyltransferase